MLHMNLRAEASVFWPGITLDITAIRTNCTHCNRITPSNPSAPPTPLSTPEYPFQYICAGFFHYKGANYVVIVDRYSNLPIVERSQAGGTGLMTCLRRTFVTYGIPNELASDGGPEFTSKETRQFLKKTVAYTIACRQSPSRIAIAEQKWASKPPNDSSPMVTLIQTLFKGPCYSTETLLTATPNCPLPCASLDTQSGTSSPFPQETTGHTVHGVKHWPPGNPPSATAICETGSDGPKGQNDYRPSKSETTSASKTRSDPTY